ncbi:hypothetical protein B0J13DRAFT_604442 [Dactylonectria estremocensis]|uniref:Uncharacterized protein n=1 Tax=Dactylonectria estremocensis TaxID=1079267 RepID=A0A9P9JCX8_9HYPO|nr:hypothetical protein B0J13DRAFT_604442 [Dactylonectria estremocensis]
MTGQTVYKADEIRFILAMLIEEKKGPAISEAYQASFGKPLTPNQLRYVKNKYGKASNYGTVDDNCSIEANRGANQANNPFVNHPFAGLEENQTTHVPQTYSRFGEGQAGEGFGVGLPVTPQGVAPGLHDMGWNGSQYPEPVAQSQAQVPVQSKLGPRKFHAILYPDLKQKQSNAPPQPSSPQNHPQLTPKAETTQFSFVLPENAPVYAGEQQIQQQQQAQVPTRIYHTNNAWAINNPDLLNFGGIPNVQTHSAGAQQSYSNQANQLPVHGTQNAQSNVPMVSPSQNIVSQQFPAAQVAQQGQIRQAVHHFNQYVANQPGDLLSPPNEVSPANHQQAMMNYYAQAQQNRQVEEPQNRQQAPMQQIVEQQANYAQHWNQYASPQPNNTPQPGQVDEYQQGQQVQVQQVTVEQQTNQAQDWNGIVSPELYDTVQPGQVDNHQQGQQGQVQQAAVEQQTNQAHDWNQYATPQAFNTPQQHHNHIPPHQGQFYTQQHQGSGQYIFDANIQRTPGESGTVAQVPNTPRAAANNAHNHNMVQRASPPFDPESQAPASPAAAEDDPVAQTGAGHQEKNDNTGYDLFLHSDPQDYEVDQDGRKLSRYERWTKDGIQVCIGDYSKADPETVLDIFLPDTNKPFKKKVPQTPRDPSN